MATTAPVMHGDLMSVQGVVCVVTNRGIVIYCYIITTKSQVILSYGSCMYNYLCNQCLSLQMLWVRISIRVRYTTLCDKVRQWLATGQSFSPGPPVSSTNKTDRHDINWNIIEGGTKHHQTNILYLRIFMSDNKSSSLSSIFSSLLSVPSFNCLTFFAAARRLAEILGLFKRYIIYGSNYSLSIRVKE